MARAMPLFRSHIRLPQRLVLVVLCLLFSAPYSEAYRLGQVVDTFLRTDERTHDVMRNQMPTFGASSSAYFAERPQQFSMSFEEGMRPLNWVNTKTGDGRMLESLDITFVFSRSGDGVIHAISCKPMYTRTEQPEGFTVRYLWVEEEEVDPQAGMAMMFLVSFLAVITMLISTCGTAGAEAGGEAPRAGRTGVDGDIGGIPAAATPNLSAGYAYPQQTMAGMPKWD